MQIKPLWLLLILGLWLAATQGQNTFTLTADSLQNGQSVELDKLGWKYAPGDDPRFADPQFDDRAWETIPNTAFDLDHLPQAGWQGIGWFRLRVQVAPEAANEQLALLMWHWGASEVYLDRRLINRFGAVGASSDTEQAFNPNGLPVGISFGTSGTHVIAVRHSAMVFRDPTSSWTQWLAKQERHIDTERLLGVGFKMSLAPAGSFRQHNAILFREVGTRLFRTGMLLTIGVLFLLLYFFYSRRSAALFFGIFAFCIGVNHFVTFLQNASHFDLTTLVAVSIAAQTSWIIGHLFLPIFLYSTISVRRPRPYWIAAALGLTSLFLYVFFPDWSVGLKLLGVMLGFVGVEILQVTLSALRQKKDGAWIIFIGVLVYTPLIFYWALADAGIIKLPEIILFIVRQISVIGVVTAISIYLARQVAQTNKDLEVKLVEVEHLSAKELEQQRAASELALEREQEKARFALVEAENERRAAELEEARQLQLSMLPKKLPSLPHLDIAAYMKTASEVGGDYYDFHLGEDGTLTIAVGDATGHGLKAGTMVASVKSLFVSLAYHPDITHIFSRLNQTLKQMQLRGLFMAMTIAKVKENHLTLSIAGMPPVWIYRAANQQIEEVMLKQIPLGGIAKYTYQQCECSLYSGDVIVLMSDGLPERFNAQNEMLEDEAAQRLVMENANLSSQEIINGLVKLGDDWGGARPQDDDVTFVVVKVR